MTTDTQSAVSPDAVPQSGVPGSVPYGPAPLHPDLLAGASAPGNGSVDAANGYDPGMDERGRDVAVLPDGTAPEAEATLRQDGTDEVVVPDTPEALTPRTGTPASEDRSETPEVPEDQVETPQVPEDRAEADRITEIREDGAVSTGDLAGPDPEGPVPDEVVASEVAERLGAVVGEDVEADPAEFAAAAVLDVLRASGWADAAEAAELRAEATRTRELLNMVVRDHRAREASMAGTENQQLHWLVPLLRAAHGVAFGSLGAKVALRTAVQDVPPEVLAQAGLRIDYGVEHVPEEGHRLDGHRTDGHGHRLDGHREDGHREDAR